MSLEDNQTSFRNSLY